MNPDSSFEAKTYRKVDLRIVPFLFLCYILAYLDRVNVGFAKLQMLKALSLSDAAFATGAGIFFIGYFFFEVPSNVLLKKFGARMWIARIMITWGIVSACMIFVRGAASFNALRFLLGIAEAGFFPGVIYYLTLWYPSRMRATRTAWFVAAIAVSGVIGNPISGWIMDMFSGARGLSGWQWLFLSEGIPSILVGFFVIYYLNSSIEEAKWLTAEEKALLAKNLAAEETKKTENKLSDAFKSVTVWVLCAIYFTLMIGLYGIAFWLPTIVKAFGIKGYLGVDYGDSVRSGRDWNDPAEQPLGQDGRAAIALRVHGAGRCCGIGTERSVCVESCAGDYFSVHWNLGRDWRDAAVLAGAICVPYGNSGGGRDWHCELGRKPGRIHWAERSGVGEADLDGQICRAVHHCRNAGAGRADCFCFHPERLEGEGGSSGAGYQVEELFYRREREAIRALFIGGVQPVAFWLNSSAWRRASRTRPVASS